MPRAPSTTSFALIFTLFVLSNATLTITYSTTDEYDRSVGLDPSDRDWFSGVALGIPSLVAAGANFAWDYIFQRTGFRVTFMVMVMTLLLGNISYALADLAQSPALIILSRAVSGAGMASNIMIRWIGITCDPSTKSQYMLYIIGAITLGFALGPITAFVISLICRSAGLPASGTSTFSRLVNEETIPAWFLAALFIMFSVVFWLAFEDITTVEWDAFAQGAENEKSIEEGRVEAGIDQTDERGKVGKEREEEQEVIKKQQDQHENHRERKCINRAQQGKRTACSALLFLGVCVAVQSIAIASFEVRYGFVALRIWSWTPETTGLAIGLIFLLVVPVVLASGFVHRKLQFEERKGVAFVAASVSLFAILLFGWPSYFTDVPTQLALWTIAIFWLEALIQVQQGLIFGLALKLSNPGLVAEWATWSTVALKLGRGAGAIFGSYAPVHMPNLYAGILLGLWGITFSALALIWNELDNRETTSAEEKEEKEEKTV